MSEEKKKEKGRLCLTLRKGDFFTVGDLRITILGRSAREKETEVQIGTGTTPVTVGDGQCLAVTDDVEMTIPGRHRGHIRIRVAAPKDIRISRPVRRSNKKWPWDVDIDTTKVGLERAMRALLLTGSTMTDSFRMRADIPLGRGVSALLRVFVPEGREEEFKELARPIEMRPPPRIQVGNRPLPPSEHPGDL